MPPPSLINKLLNPLSSLPLEFNTSPVSMPTNSDVITSLVYLIRKVDTSGRLRPVLELFTAIAFLNRTEMLPASH
jgi:hypothetical protein